jgi:hypothetical protein
MIATQARLDVCAVKLAVSREKFLRTMAVSNQYVHTTVMAVYVARGLMLVPIVGEIALIGQQGAVYANRAATLWQEAEILKQQATELKHARCEKTPFSDQPAFCVANPPVLAFALRRKRAFFPDIKHVYEWKKRDLGWVSCHLTRNPLLRTRLKIQGDLGLWKDDYSDVYAN